MASWLAVPLPSPAPRGPTFTVMTFSHLAVKLSKKKNNNRGKKFGPREQTEEKNSAFWFQLLRNGNLSF